MKINKTNSIDFFIKSRIIILWYILKTNLGQSKIRVAKREN